MAADFSNKLYLTQYIKIFFSYNQYFEIEILLLKNYLQIPACMLYLQHISTMTSQTTTHEWWLPHYSAQVYMWRWRMRGGKQWKTRVKVSQWVICLIYTQKLYAGGGDEVYPVTWQGQRPEKVWFWNKYPSPLWVAPKKKGRCLCITSK